MVLAVVLPPLLVEAEVVLVVEELLPKVVPTMMKHLKRSLETPLVVVLVEEEKLEELVVVVEPLAAAVECLTDTLKLARSE